MENIYLMECHDSFHGPTFWYALQITDVGNTIDLLRHDIDSEDSLIKLVKRLSSRYNIVVDEPEERDPLAFAEPFPIYRKITNEELLRRLEPIINPRSVSYKQLKLFQ